METKNNWKAWLYLAPALILMCIFTFYPLINTFTIAFLKNYDYLSGESVIQSIFKEDGGLTLKNIGYVLGIITFTTSFFVPGLFFFYSILGVVFSTLGRKSYKNYERAENGIKLSIASIVVSGIIIVINNSLFYTLLFLLLLIV